MLKCLNPTNFPRSSPPSSPACVPAPPALRASAESALRRACGWSSARAGDGLRARDAQAGRPARGVLGAGGWALGLALCLGTCSCRPGVTLWGPWADSRARKPAGRRGCLLSRRPGRPGCQRGRPGAGGGEGLGSNPAQKGRGGSVSIFWGLSVD